MGVLRKLTRRMVTKLFLVIGLVVGLALILQARADGRRIESSLKKETHVSAERLAQLVIGAVEHSMLAGDGVQVRTLVGDLKDHVPGADIRIYDRRGVEVFGAKVDAPDPGTLPGPIRAALAGAPRAEQAGGKVVRSIPSEERCRRCHEDEGPVRGVLEISVDRAACSERRDRVYGGLIRQTFVQLMTFNQDHTLDDFFAELADASAAVDRVGVYDTGQVLSYGSEIALDDTSMTIPLLMEERCVNCHDQPIGTARGSLRIAMAPADESDCGEGLELAVDRAVRFMMLGNLGRRVTDFLYAAVEAGAASELSVYDNEGRLRWTTNPPAPPKQVAEVLERQAGFVSFAGMGESERVTVIEPLRNDEGCQRCHGTDDALRGGVEVSLSTGMAARARADTLRESTWFTGYTLAGVLIILVALIQYLIVRPVNHIGSVADEVGRGNLDVQVVRAHAEGDEVARLGIRINEMVRGLRTKMNLEKLVSRGAAQAAVDGIARRGELRRFTVLFSDIRGFTAYSEERPPHEVVAMLNELLEAQAHRVHAHGGDIDKYVGDELMALFSGDEAEQRATRCALEMVAAVEAAHEGSLAVGVGIHCGDVVYGAIGHEERLDYTVIGDVVNTAARICSAASAHDVLVTDAIVEHCRDTDDLAFEPLEPLVLKGKRQPLRVLRASGRERPLATHKNWES